MWESIGQKGLTVNPDRDGAPTKAFEPNLFVWAAVMSHPTEDRAAQSRSPPAARYIKL
jgi:hypothetical protein